MDGTLDLTDVRRVAEIDVLAAVGKGDVDAPVVIDADVVEVQQVAARARAAAVPDAAALDDVARIGIDRDPVLAAVKGLGEVQVPHAKELVGLVVAGLVCAEECEGGAIAVT